MHGWNTECELRYGHHGTFLKDKDYKICIIKIFQNGSNFKCLVFYPGLDTPKVLSTSYSKLEYLMDDAKKIIDIFATELSNLLTNFIESPYFRNIMGYELEENNNTEELAYNVRYKEMIMGYRETDSQIVIIKKNDLKSLFLK